MKKVIKLKMMRSGTRTAHFRSDVSEPYFEESTLVQQTSFFGTRLNFTISGTLNYYPFHGHSVIIHYFRDVLLLSISGSLHIIHFKNVQ